MFFVNAGALVEGLKNANLKRILDKKLKALGKYDVLIIDEMEYLPFDSERAHCFFQLVSRRYEKSPMIFTSNKSYGEWGGYSTIMSLQRQFWIGYCTIVQLLIVRVKVTCLRNIGSMV